MVSGSWVASLIFGVGWLVGLSKGDLLTKTCLLSLASFSHCFPHFCRLSQGSSYGGLRVLESSMRAFSHIDLLVSLCLLHISYGPIGPSKFYGHAENQMGGYFSRIVNRKAIIVAIVCKQHKKQFGP